MAKPSLNLYLVFADRLGFLVAVNLSDPETPPKFHGIITAHNGEPGIFEEVECRSPSEAMRFALPSISSARATHGLKPSQMRLYGAAERPFEGGKGQVVKFRAPGA